jgi:hypothetical protein
MCTHQAYLMIRAELAAADGGLVDGAADVRHEARLVGVGLDLGLRLGLLLGGNFDVGGRPDGWLRGLMSLDELVLE